MILDLAAPMQPVNNFSDNIILYILIAVAIAGFAFVLIKLINKKKKGK